MPKLTDAPPDAVSVVRQYRDIIDSVQSCLREEGLDRFQQRVEVAVAGTAPAPVLETSSSQEPQRDGGSHPFRSAKTCHSGFLNRNWCLQYSTSWIVGGMG